jgi:simple sugar transport system permease protein
VTNDVGWTGIVVAWLAKLNTVGILVTSLLITVLQYGCQAASTSYPTIDANFADLLQGVILFVVLAADFFIRFKIVPRSKEVSQ